MLSIKEMVDKAELVLDMFTVGNIEPNQDFYFSRNVPFTVEILFGGAAIYCIQVDGLNSGSVVIGRDGSFLLSGHVRKGDIFLVKKWLEGERTNESFIEIYRNIEFI